MSYELMLLSLLSLPVISTFVAYMGIELLRFVGQRLSVG
ncbi:hypothetical protein PSBY109024_00125 [Pseudoalteromonas byunsanensis]